MKQNRAVRKGWFRLLALGVIVFGLSAIVCTDSYSAERKTPLKSPFENNLYKQLMEKKALEDGYKKLDGAVGALKLNPGIYVKDFLKENKDIEKGLNDFLRKKSVIADRRYGKDGICETDIKIEVKLLIGELKKLYAKRLHSSKWAYPDMLFENITVDHPKEFVEVTGIGKFTPARPA
jgi:hypothetical protein